MRQYCDQLNYAWREPKGFAAAMRGVLPRL
jgi:hypothetical protein